jgi:pimeloyl-ACP methyl ester carboxylesterase
MDSIRGIAERLRARLLEAPADSPTVLEQMVPTMTRVDSAKGKLLAYARASHRPTVANSMHELIVTDLRPQLGTITAPTTVLYVSPTGLPMTPKQFDELMRQSYATLKGVKLVHVDGSAHYIQIDQPARVVAEIRALMAR